MDMRELIANLGENHDDLLRQDVQCETPEQLIALAKDNKIELKESEARELLSLLYPPVGELSDSELDAVAGGTEKDMDPRPCTKRDAMEPWCSTQGRDFGCASHVVVNSGLSVPQHPLSSRWGTVWKEAWR